MKVSSRQQWAKGCRGLQWARGLWLQAVLGQRKSQQVEVVKIAQLPSPLLRKEKNVVPYQGRESPSKEDGRQGESHGGGEQTSALPGMRTRRRQTAVGSHHLGPSDSVRVTRQEREVNAGRSTSASPDRRDLRHGTEHCVPVGSPYSTRPRQRTSTDGFQPMSTDDCQPTSNRQTSRSTVTVRSPSEDIGCEHLAEREPSHRDLRRGIERYCSPVREESDNRVGQPRCEPMRQPTSTGGRDSMRDRCTPRSIVRHYRALRSPSVDTGYERLAEREEFRRYVMDGIDDTPRQTAAVARCDPRSPRRNCRDIRQFHTAEELYSPEVQRRRGCVMTMMEPYKADSSVEGFIQRFEDLRILYGWTELEQKVQLRQAMRGPAEHIVSELSYDMTVSEC